MGELDNIERGLLGGQGRYIPEEIQDRGPGLHLPQGAAQLAGLRHESLELLKGIDELVELTHLREIPAERLERFEELKHDLFERMESINRERIVSRREV
jgi:hypothetical protein